MIYVEIDDMYRTNAVIKDLQRFIKEKSTVQTVAPKSGKSENLGLVIVIDKRMDYNLDELQKIENVVFAVEDGN